MITISLCMIVKNEEAVLARCLDSIADLMDEIIIVDTGSTDQTKKIAAGYTDKIYDFAWCDDFSAARNFSFSKASCDYIYAPDADEYIDEENRQRFRQLKEVLLPEIEIVQMHYLTKAEFNTVQNSANELRPKLFKRLRSFTWIDPIHETVRTEPVVFDSDICIQHLPQSSHKKRDFSIFLKSYKRDGVLSKRIVKMYAKELLKCGNPKDFSEALPLFTSMYKTEDKNDPQSLWTEVSCVLVHAYRLLGRKENFFDVILKNSAMHPSGESMCSELLYELGCHYDTAGSLDDAYHWYYCAAFESAPILDIEIPERKALYALANCLTKYSCLMPADTPAAEKESLLSQAAEYRKAADNWTLPKE